MKAKATFRTLRLICSFALLGAVTAGTLFGWNESVGDIARAVGAVGGLVIGSAVTLMHTA